MAKELPFFKFEPSAWDSGHIQICSMESQGLFTNICSLYWQRLGDLPVKLAMQKICKSYANAFDELCKEGVLCIDGDQIIISFLDEQLKEFKNVSKERSKAALKRWSNANALQKDEVCNAIREEKKREEERREEEMIQVSFTENELILFPSFDDFWDLYDKKVGREKGEKKWAQLKQEEKELIMVHLDQYIPSTPDKKYRKNPEVYLNQKSWQDEIILRQNNNGTEQSTHESRIKLAEALLSEQNNPSGFG